MQLRIKNSFIPWSFPEIVAKEEGFFADEGIDVTFYALDPSDVEPGNKVQWYGGLVDEGKVDAYNCCAWAALDRLSDGGKNRIVGATSSMNYAFSIFVPPDSKIRQVTDLADKEILVNLRTGSHYCNLRQLEEHVPYERIRLVHGGAPHNRLLALMEGRCTAASLISPYTEVAEELGDRKSTRLNSSHRTTSYAVFRLKKKTHRHPGTRRPAGDPSHGRTRLTIPDFRPRTAAGRQIVADPAPAAPSSRIAAEARPAVLP